MEVLGCSLSMSPTLLHLCSLAIHFGQEVVPAVVPDCPLSMSLILIHPCSLAMIRDQQVVLERWALAWIGIVPAMMAALLYQAVSQ
jgi:hypothetical protein